MRIMKWDTIDFMKVDIECTEMNIFGGNSPPAWIGKVKCVSMEIHGPGFCGYSTRDSIFANMNKTGFAHQGYHGELDVWCQQNMM